MKHSFGYILQHSKRRIVIHHTHLLEADVFNTIKKGDMLFFDDCLYSQYVFIKRFHDILKRMKITCVIGFSAGLVRPVDVLPNGKIKSAELHDRYHSGDMTSLEGFMTIDEIRELLTYEFVCIACHGNNHIHFESMDISYLQKLEVFKNDVWTALKIMERYKFQTNIFVYPYAYQVPFSEPYLRSLGFIHIFACPGNNRIEIEDLYNNTNEH